MGDMIQLMFGMMRSMDRRSKEGGTRVKLDALEMPKFTGRVGEDLYRFVDQPSHFLCNYVDPTEWVARLKNAVLRDQRAFDSVVETEQPPLTYSRHRSTRPLASSCLLPGSSGVDTMASSRKS